MAKVRIINSCGKNMQHNKIKNINLVKGNAQLGFRTKDQYLYESLFFNYDLTPSIMQDAQDKIGLERMKEMLDKTTQIHIPKELIPTDLYQEYVYQCKKEKNKLSKTLKK